MQNCRGRHQYGLVPCGDRESCIRLSESHGVAQQRTAKDAYAAGDSPGRVNLVWPQPCRRFPFLVGRPEQCAAQSSGYVVLVGPLTEVQAP